VGPVGVTVQYYRRVKGHATKRDTGDNVQDLAVRGFFLVSKKAPDLDSWTRECDDFVLLAPTDTTHVRVSSVWLGKWHLRVIPS
jgi:hypothetical protein